MMTMNAGKTLPAGATAERAANNRSMPLQSSSDVPFDDTTLGAELQGRLALTPREAAPLIGVGFNKIYALCHRKDFPAIRVGQNYIIPVDALRNWLNTQAGEGCVIV